MALFALVAFFLQSLAVQTHIHPAEQPVVAKIVAAHHPAPAPLKSQDPIDQCRLCQELVHAGAFVTPSTTAVAASQAFVLAAFVVLPPATAGPATAFAWQSRAPPRR
jgi:hypothetical protein